MRSQGKHVLKLTIRYGSLPLLLIGLGFWGVWRCQNIPVAIQRMSRLPQHEKIQVYFNHNQVEEYIDPYREINRRGDNLEQIIVEQIQSAQQRVDVAVQELRSPLIAKALRDRHQQGIKVRVILENTYARPWSNYSATDIEALDEHLKARYRENLRLIDRNRDQQISLEESAEYDAIHILQSAKIPWLDDTEDGSKGSGLVHHKFVLIDGQTVVMTSANFTLSDLQGDLHIPKSRGNANSLIVIQSREVAAAFTQEFEVMWGDGPGNAPNSKFGVQKPHRPAQLFAVGDAPVWVKFSPDSASIPWEKTTNGLISKQLQTGRSQINLALFVFSEQKLANTLALAHQNGVSIRALIDRSFAFRPYSEALDLLGLTLAQQSSQLGQNDGFNCQSELGNQVWSNPIQTVGTPKLSPGDLLHHKFAVIDQSVVVVGSHNWSAAANLVNDETLVAIAHPTVAAHYQREFERLYANSRLGVPQKIQDQWKTYQARCSPQERAESENQGPDFTREESPNSFSAEVDTQINLNTATQAELEQLPGIGPKTARAIIEARQVEPFRTLDDLDRVPGIGEKTLERLRPKVIW